MIGLTKDDNNYQINRLFYPRLSTIVGSRPNPFIEKWRKRVGEEEAQRISDETSEWGTKIHLVTTYSDLKKWKKMEAMVKEDESLLMPLLTWQEWVKEYIKEWIKIETVVWSNKLKVAGTIDRVGVMKGDRKLSIHDIKTGSLWDEIGIRLYGYRLMWNERNRKKVERCVAIQLPRNDPGELKVKEYSNGKYEKKFVELCEEYHLMRR